MAQILGIDYGTKRIGLAIGDPVTQTASPLQTLQATGQPDADAQRVCDRSRDYDIATIVVGLPLNMDGTEGEQARLTRRFGDRLALHTGTTIHYQDERLSSATARENIQPAALTRKKRKARLDGIAAQVILQDYLAELTEPESAPAYPPDPAPPDHEPP